MSHEALSRPPRPWRLLLFLLALPLLYFFFLSPLASFWQAYPIEIKQRSPQEAAKITLQKLALLRDAQRSPLLRKRAAIATRSILHQTLSPANLYNDTRSFLQGGSLAQWQSHEKQWRRWIDDAQALLPDAFLYPLHAFLDLLHGRWEDGLREASRRQKEPIHHPQEALYWLWVGHSAFFAALPDAAKSAYQKALHAARQNPAWSIPSQENWRLPGELLVAHYHLALIALAHEQPRDALDPLLAILHHWEKHIKRPQKHPLWYHAQLWLGIAFHRAKQTEQAKKHIHKAMLFQGDTSLARLLAARLATPQDALKLLAPLLTPSRLHHHSYHDTQSIASLQHFLLLQNTHDLDPLLAILQRPYLPRSLAMLKHKGDYRIAFAPLPFDLLHAAIQALPPLHQEGKAATTSQPTAGYRKNPPTSQPTAISNTPAKTSRTTDEMKKKRLHAALRLYLAMQYLRMDLHQKAASILNLPLLHATYPQHTDALKKLLLSPHRPAPSPPTAKTAKTAKTAPRDQPIRSWFWGLGARGCLASSRPSPQSHQQCLRLIARLRSPKSPVPAIANLFDSLLVSDAPQRFSLSTLRWKEHQRQHLFARLDHQAPRKIDLQRRLAFHQRLALMLPEAAYLLDHTAYSLHWGTLGYTFD